MQPLKNLSWLFAIWAVSACSKIEIKDIPLYWDAGPSGAVETHLVSDVVREVDKPTWDAQRFGYACVSQEDFAWLRATLEKACAMSKVACGAEEKKAIKEFTRRSDMGMSRARHLGVK